MVNPRLIRFSVTAAELAAGVLTSRFIFNSTMREPASTAEDVATNAVPVDRENTSGKVSGQHPKPIPAQPIDFSSTPLPALNTPFVELIDGLRTRSDQGDGRAACRLAAEYAYCASLPRQLSEFERWLAQRQLAIKLVDDPGMREEIERNVRREMGMRERRLDVIKLHCKGVVQPTPAEITHHWLDAAKSGNLAAMKTFASGNAFRWDSLLDVLPELSEYKTLAEPMAIEVGKRGDQEMMLSLAAAYSPMKLSSRNLLAQSVKPDRAKATALYRFILLTISGDETLDSGHLKSEVADLISELDALPGDAEPARVTALLTEYEKDWHPFGSGYKENNRRPREGRVASIDRAECASSL